MSETTYPDGYGNPPAQKTIDQVFARSSVQMLHPEYSKRWRALMIASGGKLGIGGAGRSNAQQERVFYERHHEVKSGGCCGFNGKRYQLNTGMAHAAPPGKSFHEDVVHGYAAAVDAVGDLKWAALHCEEYGLEQATWGGEVWHFQFTEFPHSVSQWQAQGSPQPQKWQLPGTGPPTTALLGPDVSQYQQGLKPPVPHDIHFGIARASIGFMVDSTVGGPIKWCRDHRVPFCAYHFVYPTSSHAAGNQAATFHKAVGNDASIPCMIDWEADTNDNCHSGGGEQHPKWSDVLAVAQAIRKLGHKVALVYTANWYWLEQGTPNMTGAGFDLIAANYGAKPWPTGNPAGIYAARGGDTGPGWAELGGLSPIAWQFTCQATWGNQQVDFNAYKGDADDLDKWFTTWQPSAAGSPPTDIDKDDDMLFICKVGADVYVGDGVRANKVAGADLDTLKANVEGNGTARWRHPARTGLPVLTKMSDIPGINAGQRDTLVGKLS